MSVTITDLGFKFMPILATNPTIPDNKYKPNKVMHEWLFAAQGTGDGTGGTVSFNIDFGSSFDKNHYIVITYIQKNTGSSLAVKMVTNTDCWDNLYFPGHVNETLGIWNSEASSWVKQQDQLVKPIYLGRPRQKDANPGLLFVDLGTNTNAEVYNFSMQGYTLERPLPFTSILQP